MEAAMSEIQSLIICKCQVYHRVDEDKLTQLISAVRAAGISFRLMDDLCYEAVHNPEKLDGTDAIVGCSRRALLSLCAYTGMENLPLVYELNSSVDEIIQSLDNDSGNSGCEEACDRVPDDWVAWYPVIDPDRCIQCKKCVDFCMFGVYTAENGKVKVIQPSSCKTDCPACARMCPANAIIFPKSEEAAINGALKEAVKMETDKKMSFRTRLQNRKALRLFKEDE
jgi:NAD-dependent dihydropyrimidine dehydrogenase PreA subunit